jgi:CrcB protein
MNATQIAAVAIGGAAGSVARFLMMGVVGGLVGTAFPWATLAVNVLGSFVMGVIVEASALVWSPDPALRTLLTVGILGGFTTFSTFSLDVALLLQRDQWMAAGSYILLSVICSVGGLFAGMWLMRQVF